MISDWPFAQLRPLSYRAILADPPWAFEHYSERGEGRSAQRHYACLDHDALRALPVGHLAAGDCCLYLWTTGPMLPRALDLMAAWGFAYATMAHVWAKRGPRDASWHMGMGYWTRANAELCLLGTVGAPRRLARDVRQLIVAPVREHSRKPDEIHARIERLVAGPYAELFARQTRPGWDCWGDQVNLYTPEEAAP